MTTSDHSPINYIMSKNSVVCFLSLYYRASQLAGTNFWASKYLRVQFNHGTHHRQFQPTYAIRPRIEPTPDPKNVALLVTLSPTATRPKGGARTVLDPALWFDNAAAAYSILPHSCIPRPRMQGMRDAEGLCGREEGHAFTARHNGITQSIINLGLFTAGGRKNKSFSRQRGYKSAGVG
jgi:hypothetical protein